MIQHLRILINIYKKLYFIAFFYDIIYMDNVGDKMARILDLDRKYQILIIIFISIFLALIALAITLSNIKFTSKPEGSVAVVLNDGDLVINYVDGNEVTVNDRKEMKYGVTITNSSNNTIYYSLGFSEVNRDASVVVEDIEGNELENANENLASKKIINLYSINGGETIRFVLRIKATNGTFKGKILVTNESLTTQTFSDIILLNNLVVSPKSRLGGDAAKENEGLISTQDNDGISYFFRGNVKNNYLKIGDYYFRVVRINGDETVRVVLDGVIEKPEKYNTKELEENGKIEFMARLDNTSLKDYLNNWLKDNLGDYDKYLANGKFCTDINFSNNINDIKYSSTYERIFVDEAPDLICRGAIYNNKIGLLSVDEVVLAGAYKNVPNEKYYLYNEDIKGNYLTLSSYYINASGVISMMNVISDGSLGDGVLVTTPSYIRPVLNINTNAKLKGEGTYENPYIIVS